MKKIAFILLSFFSYSGFSQEAKLDNEQLLDMIQGQRYREAASYIKSVFPDEIKDPRIKARLAYCNYMSGNLVEAEKTYLAILSSDSTNKSALNYLAAISENRRNYSQAKTFYQKLIKLDSLNYRVYKQVAYIEYFNKSINSAISNNVPIYYQELSINNEMLKRFKTSIVLLNKAEEFKAKNIFNYSRARIYGYNLNDQKNALKYYKKYLQEYDKSTDDMESYNFSLLRVKDLAAKSSAKH